MSLYLKFLKSETFLFHTLMFDFFLIHKIEILEYLPQRV